MFEQPFFVVLHSLTTVPQVQSQDICTLNYTFPCEVGCVCRVFIEMVICTQFRIITEFYPKTNEHSKAF